MQVKVVGTTFRPFPEGTRLSVDRTWETESHVPCAAATVILQPEPDNPYDPGAIKVIAQLTDGRPFHMGYIGKDDPIKATLLERFATQPMMIGRMEVRDYGQVGQLNPSFVIQRIEGIAEEPCNESNAKRN